MHPAVARGCFLALTTSMSEMNGILRDTVTPGTPMSEVLEKYSQLHKSAPFFVTITKLVLSLLHDNVHTCSVSISSNED